jgi:hypothetical protein
LSFAGVLLAELPLWQETPFFQRNRHSVYGTQFDGVPGPAIVSSRATTTVVIRGFLREPGASHAAEKPNPEGGGGFQPPHKAKTINAGFSAGGMLFTD